MRLGHAPVRAPEFVEHLDWVNTGGREIRLADLRGRVVLLDFWTYGCINCRHVQPWLRELERRFADTLTVIGVHSGKFVHERKTANLAAACDRQEVAHAVVNDRQFRIWRSYDVSAWPTTALIGCEGELIEVQPGEFDLARKAERIEAVVEQARRAGTLVPGPDPAAREAERSGDFLRFPGRVLLDGERMLVSDTGHGRVLDCRLHAEVAGPVATVLAEHTGFIEPQGLALTDREVLVADRAGQAVWRIDAEGGRSRILGTGELARGSSQGGHGPEVPVRSPWALAVSGGQLTVSMAGSHQLWRVDLASLESRPWAGTGAEELIDGSLTRALLAQPTGLSLFGAGVAFADCESSAIRLADEDEGVRTLVGRGLFTFGDRDGSAAQALLQHAEDLAAHRGVLAVADTYNDRLKSVDPRHAGSRPWDGAVGEAGFLCEPAGVSSDGTRLAIADTGNHRIVLVGTDGRAAEVRFA